MIYLRNFHYIKGCVHQLFLTIVYTDLNSNVSPERDGIFLMLKMSKFFKKRLDLLKIAVREMWNVSEQNFNILTNPHIEKMKNCQIERVS